LQNSLKQNGPAISTGYFLSLEWIAAKTHNKTLEILEILIWNYFSSENSEKAKGYQC